jgi:hypothetical protein
MRSNARRARNIGTRMSADDFSLPAIASAAAAWIALILSGGSLLVSRKAMKIAQQQEDRRKPLLVPYYRDGFFQRDPDGNGRIYALLLSISNRSDSNNTIAELELRITYSTPDNRQVTLKLRAEAKAEQSLEPLSFPYLAMPQRIDGHQAVICWCHFRLSAHILESFQRIERYVVGVIDSDVTDATVEPILLSNRYGPRDTSEADSLA